MTDAQLISTARSLVEAEVYDGDWEIKLVMWAHDGGIEAFLRHLDDDPS